MESFLYTSLEPPSSLDGSGGHLTYERRILSDSTSSELLHWHEQTEISIVREGNAVYQIGQDHFCSQKGDLIFIAPNVLHSITQQSSSPYITDNLIFHSNFLRFSGEKPSPNSHLSLFFDEKYRPLSQIDMEHPAYKDLSECINNIFSSIVSNDSYLQLLLKENLYHLIYLLFSKGCMNKADIPKTAALYTTKIKLVLLYVREHYMEPLAITNLADICNFSETHFMSFFKKTANISCIDYIIQLRLKIAAAMLHITNLPIAQIAVKCGYHNLSNFNRQFKAYFQISPKNYRKL